LNGQTFESGTANYTVTGTRLLLSNPRLNGAAGGLFQVFVEGIQLAQTIGGILGADGYYHKSGSGETGGTSDADGTWISATTFDDANYFKFVAASGSFKQYLASSKTATTWKEVVRGTYPKGAKSPVPVTITEANTIMFGGADEWKTWADLGSDYQKCMGGSQTHTLTISNNQFVAYDLTFEKQ
jgi:hypothetical protein